MNTKLSSLCLGSFVATSQENLGIGKLVSISSSTAAIEWFTSISNREVKEYDTRSIKRVVPREQTRCYVYSESTTIWTMGRIMGWSSENSSTGIEYDVHFSGGRAEYVPEEYVFVRCNKDPSDPVDTLILHTHDTPFFHTHRKSFVNSTIQQRAASHGLTGLVSSRIELYPHQIRVVRRVLEDPVQRYLLADEVGLGKTIETGVILRQTLLDYKGAHALIVAPRQLMSQWRLELEDRFQLVANNPSDFENEDSQITLCAYDEIQNIPPNRQFDIVVIDEAQHVAIQAHNTDDHILWERCRQFSHTSPKLLLLSATPALHREEDFLAMLHLLEPETYKLEDIQAFRKKVDNRQPIGELLLLFREGIPRPPLRRCLSVLRQLFKEDEWIQDRVKELQSCCDSKEYDREQVDSIIHSVRVHICEIHRIYRRMLRTSRSSLPENILSPRAENSDRPKVVEEFGFDERLTRVNQLLENWRMLAVETVDSANDSDKERIIDSLSDIFSSLLECTGSWLQVLRWAVECRLGKDKKLQQYKQILGLNLVNKLVNYPLLRDEEVILNHILEELSLVPEDGDQIDTFIQFLEYQFRRTKKIIVFVSNTRVAQEIIERINVNSSLKRAVLSHINSNSEEILRNHLITFNSGEGPYVLVCDESGEEGLNLQKADILVHFDFPWDPNRLEQRMGRVDRIGRTGEVHSYIFVAISDDDDDDQNDSPLEAWYKILLDGFCIFSQSIADLQFFTKEIMIRLKHIALIEGANGLFAQIENVKQGVVDERRIISEQNVLDEIEAFDQHDIDFCEDLVAYDNQGRDMQVALESWAVEALHFMYEEKELEHPDMVNSTLEHISHSLVRYKHTDRTLVPKDWWISVRDELDKVDKYATYSRDQGCELLFTPVLRIGHSFVTALMKYVRWDDRGKAFILWRHIPNSQIPINSLCFELDYIIETDLSHVNNLLNDHGFGPEANLALSHKADAWLPPEYSVIYVDSDVKIIENPQLLNVLQRPYRSFDKGGTDYNLNINRQQAMNTVISPDRWQELCENVRGLAESTMRSSEDLENHLIKSSERAIHELERRMEQLRYGLIYQTTAVRSNGMSTDIDSIIMKERELYEALIQGIKKPAIKLDAMGLFIISSSNPFDNEGEYKSDK
ncbi:protein DpdE [Chloroflexota bacterium]